MSTQVVETDTPDKAPSSVSTSLVSTWRLKSHVQHTLATGELSHPRGPKPQGLVTYTADGRFALMNVPGERQKPAAIQATPEEAVALYQGLTAYAGRYSIEDNTIVHHVELSWNEAWTGTDQRRRFKIEGDELTLIAGPSANHMDGKVVEATLKWERVR
ncbi:lipocalin-like domain-containing protein [Labrys neptuniae]